ncbi:hypothetical protein N665_1286s0013 [Sinapis alba]|nr:hypothetical protein N665_1286s0013 [Sinapis alba]
MKGSDFRKIGAKLKDLVPCVLISFENEQILIWRGREWKSSLTVPDKKDDILRDIDVDTVSPEEDEASESLNQTQTVNQNSSSGHMELHNGPDGDDFCSSKVNLSAMEGASSTLQSSSTEDATELNKDNSLGDDQEPEQEPETSEEINRQSVEGVLNMMKQAVESGAALVLDAADLDPDTVFAKAVAFSSVATPGPVFQHGLRKQPAVKKEEKREFGYKHLEAKTSSSAVVSGRKEVAVRVERYEKKMDELDDEDYREVIPHGTLKVDELAKLLA